MARKINKFPEAQTPAEGYIFLPVRMFLTSLVQKPEEVQNQGLGVQGCMGRREDKRMNQMGANHKSKHHFTTQKYFIQSLPV